jgi:peptidoglycan/xylan/chitin deacetylase (PgdA/CDA1 family)
MGNIFTIIIMVLMFIGALGVLYYVIPYLLSKYFKYRQGVTAKRKQVIVLTFDDGPGVQLTARILRILKENSIKASFFLTVSKVNDNKTIVKQIRDDGHDICNHGYEHRNYWKISPMHCFRDMRRSYGVLDAVMGVRSGRYPFRPPGGKLNFLCMIFCFLRRVDLVFWSDIGGDTLKYSAFEKMNVIRKIVNSRGSVLLLHDFDRREADDYVVCFLRELIKQARVAGIGFLPYSDLKEGKYA